MAIKVQYFTRGKMASKEGLTVSKRVIDDETGRVIIGEGTDGYLFEEITEEQYNQYQAMPRGGIFGIGIVDEEGQRLTDDAFAIRDAAIKAHKEVHAKELIAAVQSGNVDVLINLL